MGASPKLLTVRPKKEDTQQLELHLHSGDRNHAPAPFEVPKNDKDDANFANDKNGGSDAASCIGNNASVPRVSVMNGHSSS